MDEETNLIEKIDTSKVIKPNLRDIVTALISLQVKMNEIIDVVNIYLMPDEPLDDDEEDEPTVVSPSNVHLGSKNKK